MLGDQVEAESLFRLDDQEAFEQMFAVGGEEERDPEPETSSLGHYIDNFGFLGTLVNIHKTK